MFSHKYSAAQKIRACEDYLSGKYNSYDACERNGIHYKKETRSDSALRQWVAKYVGLSRCAVKHRGKCCYAA